jgi:hypothetical protein
VLPYDAEGRLMHFLRESETFSARPLARPHAAVRVRFSRLASRRTLTVCSDEDDPCLCVMRADASVVRLPADVAVVEPDGTPIKPSRTFMVTLETFNPYHLLSDVEG